MSLDLAFGIARTGLLATQRALANVSQNIANAQTEGYTRKEGAATATNANGQGTGVRLGVATRSVDAALVTERNARASDAAAADARQRLLSGIEAAHGSVAAGDTLGDAIGAMGDSFLALRAAPGDPGLQRQVVADAQAVAARFNQVGQAVGEARGQAQSGIATAVRAANAALRDVAALSVQIVATRSSGASTAAMEDARDAAIARLAEQLPVRAIHQADGNLTLVSGGMTLPLDPRRDVLSFDETAIGPTTWHGAGGLLPGVMLGGRDVTAQLSGGTLGALVELRDRTLPRFQAELDVAAGTLAARMQAQGLRLFTDNSGNVPDMALPYAAAGSGQVGFANLVQVNAAVLAAPSLVRDGTHAVAATVGGPTAFTPNPAGGPSGFATLVSRVTEHALGATASAGNAWAPIATTGLGPDGTLASSFMAQGAVADFAAALTGAQAGARADAAAALERAGTLRSGLDARFAAQSGVDADGEMAAMVQLQNAYAANARVMNTAQEMFDLLLTIGR